LAITPMSLPNPLPLFPSLGFFPTDLVGLKFLLSPSSQLSLGPLEYLKRLYHIAKNELTWNHLSTDLKTFILVLASSQAQRFVYVKLLDSISPPRKVYSGKTGLGGANTMVAYAVPETEYLLAKFGSYVFVRSLFYPLSTAIVRLADQKVTLTEFFSLFTSTVQLRSLYNGFTYNLIWSAGYAALSCAEDLMIYKYVTAKEGDSARTPAVVIGGTVALYAAEIALVPLRLRVLFCQAGHLPGSWVPSFWQGITALGMRNFTFF